jgi:hypothetical protein
MLLTDCDAFQAFQGMTRDVDGNLAYDAARSDLVPCCGGGSCRYVTEEPTVDELVAQDFKLCQCQRQVGICDRNIVLGICLK